MTAFEVVIFDYDGTLFDTRPAIVHCIRRAFEECGRLVPTPDQALAAVKTGLPLQETLHSLDPRLRGDRVGLSEMIKTYRKVYADEGAVLVKPFDGAGETLRAVHAGGAKCIVVSNKGIEAIRRSLDQSGLDQFVDQLFADEPGLPKKPDPLIVTDHILPHCGPLRREQILIVGDTEIDILFARRTGTRACWASYGYGEAERCRKLAPDHEISSIVELQALVRPS